MGYAENVTVLSKVNVKLSNVNNFESGGGVCFDEEMILTICYLTSGVALYF